MKKRDEGTRAMTEEGRFQICNLRECPEVVPALARWQHAEWAHLNPGDTEKARAVRLQNQAKSEDLPQTWVAVSGREPAGSASLVPCDMDTRPEWAPWLASVFVAPEHRGRGLGAALVRRVMDEAASRGFPKLYLFTEDRTGFYERLGWVFLASDRYRGKKVTVMVAELSHSDR